MINRVICILKGENETLEDKTNNEMSMNMIFFLWRDQRVKMYRYVGVYVSCWSLEHAARVIC